MDFLQYPHQWHEDSVRHWMYSNSNIDSCARPSYNRDQILYGVGESLHVDPLSVPSPFLGAYEFGSSHYPPAMFPNERQMQDLNVPSMMGCIGDFNQYHSPRSDSSSQGCDTYSTCFSEDVQFKHRHSVASTSQFDQPYFSTPCDLGTADYDYHDFNQFPTAPSPEMPPEIGGGISLSIVQASPDQALEGNEVPDPSYSNEDDPDAEGESDHDFPLSTAHNKVYEQLRVAPLPETYDEDSFAESAQDSMSIGYDDPSEEDEDGDYNPRGKKSTGRARRASAPRRGSLNRKGSTGAAGCRVMKPRAKKPNSGNVTKFFPCPLTQYGCMTTFTSKNEWKRHVSTQHIKQGFWRCDMCPPTDPSNPSYNDFNRKDLFIQHLRRMHRNHPLTLNIPSDGVVKLDENDEPEISDEAVVLHQQRCYVTLRANPKQSECLFCSKHFEGETSWEERMEHVGAHIERDRKSHKDVAPCSEWRDDPELQEYLLQEGLVIFEGGKWGLGDGVPLRNAEDNAGH